MSWDVMTTKSRKNHPARQFFYTFLKNRFGKQQFSMLDIGIVSMVDYQRLRKEYNLNFKYVGADVNEEILKQANGYVQGDDECCLWDIHHKPPESFKNHFDVVLVKHMLHYCKSYTVLDNVKMVMKSDGHILVVNNKNIYTSKNTVKDNGEILYSFGQYTTTYSQKAYLKYLRKSFKCQHQAFSGSGKVKPYTIDILEKCQ